VLLGGVAVQPGQPGAEGFHRPVGARAAGLDPLQDQERRAGAVRVALGDHPRDAQRARLAQQSQAIGFGGEHGRGRVGAPLDEIGRPAAGERRRLVDVAAVDGPRRLDRGAQLRGQRGAQRGRQGHDLQPLLGADVRQEALGALPDQLVDLLEAPVIVRIGHFARRNAVREVEEAPDDSLAPVR